MLTRFSVKNLLYVIIILLPIILSACVASVTPSSAPISATATAQLTSTQAPTPIDDLATQKQKILDEVSREVADYNQLVEQEKLLGNIENRHNSETGQDFFVFTGESNKKIRAAYENLVNRMNILRARYLVLYRQDYSPTPFPTFSTKEEALNFYYQVLQENQVWLESQLKAENALRVYDSDRGNYMSFLSFDQDVWLGLRNEALNKLRMEAELSPELLAKHTGIVEKLDGEPVEANEITSLPYYRNDITLFQYQTRKNYYVLNAEGAIIEITLIQGLPVVEITPNAPLNADQLEEKALSFINLIAPGTSVDTLTPQHGSKIDTFFFKWEDRTKPPLDGGGFPFIQAALNLNGELLNYINTLPLSR